MMTDLQHKCLYFDIIYHIYHHIEYTYITTYFKLNYTTHGSQNKQSQFLPH